MTDQEFLAKAQTHWTPEREAKVTGDKHWPLLPSEAPLLLRTLGLLNSDASMPADALRKFSQINHMVTLLLPAVEELASRHKQVRVLDACCGTSYLTLLLGWVLKNKLQKPAQIVGIDANARVIAKSQKSTAAVGLDDWVRFQTGRIGELAWESAYPQLFPKAHTDDVTPGALRREEERAPRPHLVIALHACDTATDDALGEAVRLQADSVAVAPCCQAELARKWKEANHLGGHPLTPIFQSPHFRREIGAQMTDVMRMTLLRAHGYEVTATEFVASSHTPKNRLLLATRRGRYLASAASQYVALKQSFGGVDIKLAELLERGD